VRVSEFGLFYHKELNKMQWDVKSSVTFRKNHSGRSLYSCPVQRDCQDCEQAIGNVMVDWTLRRSRPLQLVIDDTLFERCSYFESEHSSGPLSFVRQAMNTGALHLVVVAFAKVS
jgi:hypothetical protein